jgi:hypothetical protein
MLIRPPDVHSLFVMEITLNLLKDKRKLRSFSPIMHFTQGL